MDEAITRLRMAADLTQNNQVCGHTITGDDLK